MNRRHNNNTIMTCGKIILIAFNYVFYKCKRFDVVNCMLILGEHYQQDLCNHIAFYNYENSKSVPLLSLSKVVFHNNLVHYKNYIIFTLY